MGDDFVADRHADLGEFGGMPDSEFYDRLAAGLHPCAKPDCRRLVSVASLFCCPPCAQASEGRYEIHAHSEACDGRAALRGPVPPPGAWVTYRAVHDGVPDHRAQVQRVEEHGVLVVDEQPGMPLEHLVPWDRLTRRADR